jgi:hypothetical protein
MGTLAQSANHTKNPAENRKVLEQVRSWIKKCLVGAHSSRFPPLSDLLQAYSWGFYHPHVKLLLDEVNR